MLSRLFIPRYATAALFPDGMDWHTHILWGVDDGAASIRESLAIIRQLKSMGLKGACCTPHIASCYPNNTPDNLRRRFDQLLQQAEEERFRLLLSAEYLLEEQFEEQLRHHPLLTHDGLHLLVELPQHRLPRAWKDTISLIRDRGYIPVLAHPERYGYILQEEELYQLAEQEGVQFQGNAGSLGGLYGRQVASIAKKLKQQRLYSCWGTDSHSAAMARRMPLKP